jgi:hypothetical protein
MNKTLPLETRGQVHTYTNYFTSMECAKSLMMTSYCDVLLIDRIDEKFDELHLYIYKQGGVTYVKIALDKMLTISKIQPSRDSLKLLPKTKMALPRQMRMSVLLRNRSLLSLRDWLKYLCSQVKVPVIFLKGSLGALLSYSGRLLHICWLLSGCNSFVT